jgi:isopenicillin N synthase-like dioxygenase
VHIGGKRTRPSTKRPLVLIAMLSLHGQERVAFTAGYASGSATKRTDIPLIDLSPWISPSQSQSTTKEGISKEQLEVVCEIHKACREVGFFMITNHGFNDTLMDHAWKASKEFFDLSLEEKLLHKTTNEKEYPYGFEQSETLVRGKALDSRDGSVGNIERTSREPQASDRKETFAIGPSNPDSGMPSRRWAESPNLSTDFRPILEAYYRHMEGLATVLLRIFALALEEPITYFDDKMDRHMSALRLVNYYPLAEPPSEGGIDDNNFSLVRAGAHTDYGALTILAAKDKGLQVLLTSEDDNNDRKQEWVSVPVVPRTLIVNLGDLMQRWTNDEWVSTMHRVVMPSTHARERRYSMAYFVNINGETLIEPLPSCRNGEDHNDISMKYPAITAREHLMAKHLASMGETIDTIRKTEAEGDSDGHRQRDEL